MIISICGTPGVGKTTVSVGLSCKGFDLLDLRKIIVDQGLFEEGDGDGHELLVDVDVLEDHLSSSIPQLTGNTVIDGHLSYLAPSDICIVLRMEPGILKDRLMKRDYSEEKVRENVEAEALGCILVEALEMENERLEGRRWEELTPGCGTVFEMDISSLSREKALEEVLSVINRFEGKKLNELSQYRPGRIDWLEVVAGWF